MSKSQKKILMIAPQSFYVDRGTPMNVKLMCQILGEAGYEVDLLVFPGGKHVSLKNVRIFRLPNLFRAQTIPAGPSAIKFTFDLLIVVYACMLSVRYRYDVFHGVEEGGFLAVALGKLLKKNSIFDMDSCISEQLNFSGFVRYRIIFKFVQKIEKWALRRSTLVLTVCSALSDTASLIAPNAHIEQIEDIPQPSIASFDQDLVDSLLDEFKLRDVNIVLYSGNLEQYQGIDFLLAAWRVVLREYRSEKNITLVIVGGPHEKVKQYKNIAKDMNIDASVCFVGPRPLNEMGAWMYLSHVLVSPRLQGENTPLKIYSYMASGRPLVVTNMKTHTQILNKLYAYLSEVDPVSFGKNIIHALYNTKESETRASRAKQLLKNHYSYEIFEMKLLRAYSFLE